MTYRNKKLVLIGTISAILSTGIISELRAECISQESGWKDCYSAWNPGVADNCGDGCTKMYASGCTKCKNENFKLNDGECDRLRYTPAEAAEVLRDDNTNSVTITFKK